MKARKVMQTDVFSDGIKHLAERIFVQNVGIMVDHAIGFEDCARLAFRAAIEFAKVAEAGEADLYTDRPKPRPGPTSAPSSGGVR